MAEPTRWQRLPEIELATPVLAVAADAADAADAAGGDSAGGDSAGGGAVAGRRLWLGGMGGVAEVIPGGDGAATAPRVPGLSTVAALCRAGSWLVAGGAEGIARYRDGAYEFAEVQSGGAPVAALLTVPAAIATTGDGDHDPDAVVLLAATLGDGILRSDDRGRTWVPANFGLDDADVSDLIAGPSGTVFAATANGVFASTPGLRAWRRCAGTDGAVLAALASAPGSAAIAAAGEDGRILRSGDGGRTWTPGGTVPAAPTAMVAAADGSLVLGTAGAGIWRSVDAGDWTRVADDQHAAAVYCLAGVGRALYAGTSDGLAESDDAGLSWKPVAVPATHDLDRVLVHAGRPLVVGGGSGLVHLDAEGEWTTHAGVPFPLTAVAVAPGGALLASGPAGLFRHPGDRHLNGDAWEAVVPGEAGHVGVLSFRADGLGWAGSAQHGDALLHTSDGGASWQVVPAPFGVLPLTALQAADGVVLAATSDRRLGAVQLWASSDDGATWNREARAETAWPIVDALADPALLSLGRALCTRDGAGLWSQWAELDDGVRAVTGDSSGVVVLTASGIWTVTDDGRPGVRLDDGIDVAEVLDIEASGGTLFALLTGGRVWWRETGREGGVR